MATGLTRKGAPPLLRMVGGKRHASDKDHEEPAYKGRPDTNEKAKKRKEEEEEEEEKEEQLINAEPLSTDDELQQPPPRPSPSSRRKIAVPIKKVDAELKQPQRKSSRKAPPIRAPAKGSYQSGKADKATKGVEDDKENATSTQSSVEASEDQGWGFAEEFRLPSPKKQKTQYGANARGASSRANIHAPPAKKFGTGPSKNVPRAKGKTSYTRKNRTQPQEEDDVSDVSMMSNDELDRILKTGPQDKDGKSTLAPLDDEELKNILDEPSKPTRILYQLGDWVQDQAPPSSQLESSAPQEALDNIKEYIEQLPQDEAEGTRCSLCKELVELEDYWEFWKGRDKTVKNHTAYCTRHRRKSAQEEYRGEGYPEIEWDALPQRIKAHRQDLYKVLNNKRPSRYRERYEPLALTGKAAAVPSRRKDLPQEVQDELDSYALDDKATYPGYYGPHGRRIITENVMKVLKNEIKTCRDSVVQASGPAAFVQAVLVPEVAILLIMEDCTVDREEAEEIREKTYDMGLLLNEEIEDSLEVQDDSEDDNEYHHG
ncbi:uncharacterized protein K460DRAFT_349497 [Cucurbitaria berberidis CBS 394.84]|uniref:Restriction of telomere capping protein 4 n=1 Tax=Cucurbitaria berberidis CBS 394.84 TaxID=1168544 RepID=A0A9P4G6L0_9PLEO|nr:uncharacterized protein K460DRAFT_349497 [Cucurbitaria berberidis CBS 394.84]KAF1839958.1 hypothetical protein K460DRAFT_349497 [Cucurbitaria berberidis CBS 394.84]